MKKILLYTLLFVWLINPAEARFTQQLFDKVKGSVFPVMILGEETEATGGTYQSISSYAGSPLLSNPEVEEERLIGGTGFLVELEGERLVITNAAIQAGENQTIAAVIDYEPHELELIGTDRFYDISILRFPDTEFSKKILPLTLSPLPVFQNQEVFTVAAPADYISHYISEGKISLVNNENFFSGKIDYLLHASRLIDGCNGSPIINEIGEVVGMNTSFVVKSKAATVVALESQTLKELVKRIMANNGKVERSFLGIEFGKKSFGTYEKRGSDLPMITGIIDGGPADQVLNGKQGYFITRINGTEINNLPELLFHLETIEPGAEISFQIASDFRGFGVENVSFYAEQMDEENLGKIGSYYLSQNDLISGNADNDANGIILTVEDNNLSDGPFYEVESLTELGQSVRVEAWGNILESLKNDSTIKIDDELINSYHFNAMNALYY